MARHHSLISVGYIVVDYIVVEKYNEHIKALATRVKLIASNKSNSTKSAGLSP